MPSTDATNRCLEGWRFRLGHFPKVPARLSVDLGCLNASQNLSAIQFIFRNDVTHSGSCSTWLRSRSIECRELIPSAETWGLWENKASPSTSLLVISMFSLDCKTKALLRLSIGFYSFLLSTLPAVAHEFSCWVQVGGKACALMTWRLLEQSCGSPEILPFLPRGRSE